MSDPLLAIQRVRLEVDQTLRGRAFFARAIRGELPPPPYDDLLVQLSGLAVAGGEVALEALARADLAADPPKRALIVEIFTRAIAASGVDEATRTSAVLSTMGTSWLTDAAERLGRRHRTSFLVSLLARGHESMGALGRGLVERDPESVHAVAELTRGALLGVATYLEARWPPRAQVLLVGSN